MLRKSVDAFLFRTKPFNNTSSALPLNKFLFMKCNNNRFFTSNNNSNDDVTRLQNLFKSLDQGSTINSFNPSTPSFHSNNSVIDPHGKRIINKLLNFQGLARISTIKIDADRLPELLDYYRNHIKPVAYNDRGFIESYLLVSGENSEENRQDTDHSDNTITVQNVTLWKDFTSLERNNQSKDYQHAMNGLDEFILELPTVQQFHLAETVKNEIQITTKQPTNTDNNIQINPKSLITAAKDALNEGNVDAAMAYANCALSLDPSNSSSEVHSILFECYKNKAQPSSSNSKRTSSNTTNNHDEVEDPMEEALNITGESAINRSLSKIRKVNKSQPVQFPPLNTGVSYS